MVGLSVFAASVALGQDAMPDSVRCSKTLNAPTADSMPVELRASFQAIDTSQKLPDEYRALLGLGLREMLVLPHPLFADVYDRRDVAWPRTHETPDGVVTLRSVYLLTLYGNGHLRSARPVAGVRSASFDGAIVSALTALDSSGLLRPPGGAGHDTDSLPLRLTVEQHFLTSLRSFKADSTPAPGTVPLFRVRLPVRHVDREIGGVPGGPFPHYPPNMRAKGIEGGVLLEFVVGTNGTFEPGTLQLVSMTSREFLDSVLEVLPRLRFYPLEVAGCKVPGLTTMPFLFGLNR